MRSHVNTALWNAETRKEHTEWLLPFFDSIAAYFFKETPQLHPVSGWFLRKAPQLHPISGQFLRKAPQLHPVSGWFLRKTPQLHPVSGRFLRKAPQLHPVSGWFWVSGSGIASVFKSGCDDFLLHWIWETKEKEATGICYKPST